MVPRHQQLNTSNDSVKVRIRGKNCVESKTGSVTRTLREQDSRDRRAQELKKTTERIKVLEQIEKYREERMAKELAMYEMEK